MIKEQNNDQMNGLKTRNQTSNGELYQGQETKWQADNYATI